MLNISWQLLNNGHGPNSKLSRFWFWIEDIFLAVPLLKSDSKFGAFKWLDTPISNFHNGCNCST